MSYLAVTCDFTVVISYNESDDVICKKKRKANVTSLVVGLNR